jgi:hypothetical protein
MTRSEFIQRTVIGVLNPGKVVTNTEDYFNDAVKVAKELADVLEKSSAAPWSADIDQQRLKYTEAMRCLEEIRAALSVPRNQLPNVQRIVETYEERLKR